MLHILISF